MPSFSAISSIAISSAIRPGASPGARIALPSGRSSAASFMKVSRLAPAYISLVCATAVSGFPSGRLPEVLSWAIAVRVPSRVAPSRMRWMVAARCVLLLGIIGRVIASFTGRPAARAPTAAITASARTNSLPPKPPPMNGESIRTFSSGIPKAMATSLRLQAIIWLEVHNVTRSPSHAAMVANGSIIMWLWSGVV